MEVDDLRRSEYDFIRLYDKNNNHYASIIACGCDYNHSENCGKMHHDLIDDNCDFDCCKIVIDYDLANPDGKVLYCGITPELFESFVKCSATMFNFKLEYPEDFDD